jgi:tetratricopeptide (TPR) repeat protein
VLVSIQRERLGSRLKLARLPLQDTRQMLAALLNERAPEDFVEGIYHETEGNPFFIEEVCKSLVENGGLTFQDGHWQHPDLSELQIPQSVRVTIQARLGKLPADYQEVLRMAAILGRDFDYEVLARAVEMDEELLIEALEQAEHAQLIEETGSQKGGTFRFVHALIPMTLLEGLIGLRRRKLHRRAAEAIEQLRPDDLEALAYQYSQAEVPEKALRYLSSAGRRAQARYANEDAIRYYSAALEFCEQERECFVLLAARERVYHLVARRQEQMADLHSMQILAEQLDDDRLRFDALLALADYAAHTDYIRAATPAEQALALAQKMADAVRQGRALYILAFIANFDGNQRRSIEYLNQAMDKFQAAGQEPDIIPCLYLLSLAHINLGEHAAGQQAAEQAVQLSRKLKDRRQEAISLRRLGIALDSQDRKSEALELFQAALILHREVGDRAEECNALNAIAGVLAGMGRLDEARPYFEEGLELAESIGQDLAVGMIIGNMMAFYYQGQGDYQGGLDLLERYLKHGHTSGDQGLVFTLSRSATEIYAEIGQYNAALHAAEAALQVAEQRDLDRAKIELMAWCGRLHALMDNFRDAHARLESALEKVKGSDDPDSYPDVIFNSAYVGWLEDDPAGWRKGLELVEQVSERWRGLKAEYPLIFSLDLKARLFLALGEPERAEICSAEAVQVAEALHATSSLVQVCYTRARVLWAVGRLAEANEYLQRAYERVQHTARLLASEKLQRGWLQNVRYNREIVEEWQARLGGMPAEDNSGP